MPASLPGYVYVDSIQIDDLCYYIDGGPLSEELDDLGVDYGAKGIGCAAITLVGVGSGNPVFTVAGVVCSASLIGCAANDAIRNNTTCGRQYIDVYAAEELSDGEYHPAPVTLGIRCGGDFDIDQIADDIADDMQDVADDAADVTVDVGSDVADEIADAADDVAGGATDVYNWGTDIVF